MKLPARHLLALCATAGLLLTGCAVTPDTKTASGAGEPTVSTSDAPETAGVCDAKSTGAAASPAADAEASRTALAGVGLGGDAAAAPTVSFEAPLGVGAEVALVADAGGGEAIQDGQLITIMYVVCDIDTGEKLYSTWGATATDDAPEIYILSADNFGETLASTFVGASTGARLLWAQPGLSADQSSTGAAENGFLYAITVTDNRSIPETASGTEVTPTDADLPAIGFTDGRPTVTIPASFQDPADLVVQPLIEGDGAPVEAGQTVVVKYSGWLTDGTGFDSSWERPAPSDKFQFTPGAGEVIQAWDEGVAGHNVGSRLLLVVPSEFGYGAEGAGDIPADATLIFVVDILAAY